MQLLDARTGMEQLTRAQCLELLSDDEIGRLALIDFGTPMIFPVNYVMDGECVVFRTDPGTKLAKGAHARVSFEIDRFDREHRSGWSVVMFGRLDEVTKFETKTYDRVRDLGIEPWADGEKQHWMRLVPDRITGRRVGPAAR